MNRSHRYTQSCSFVLGIWLLAPHTTTLRSCAVLTLNRRVNVIFFVFICPLVCISISCSCLATERARKAILNTYFSLNWLYGSGLQKFNPHVPPGRALLFCVPMNMLNVFLETNCAAITSLSHVYCAPITSFREKPAKIRLLLPHRDTDGIFVEQSVDCDSCHTKSCLPFELTITIKAFAKSR